MPGDVHVHDGCAGCASDAGSTLRRRPDAGPRDDHRRGSDVFSRPIRGRAAKLSSRCQRRQQSLDTKITINFHDQAAPDLYDLDQGSNALLFRGLVPHKLGGIGQLLRYTLPVVTAPDGQGGTVTGLGDLNVLDLFPFALKESLGQAGRWQSPYHDTMIDHDKNVGSLLDYLDKLGIADNTFVMYRPTTGRTGTHGPTVA